MTSYAGLLKKRGKRNTVYKAINPGVDATAHRFHLHMLYWLQERCYGDIEFNDELTIDEMETRIYECVDYLGYDLFERLCNNDWDNEYVIELKLLVDKRIDEQNKVDRITKIDVLCDILLEISNNEFDDVYDMVYALKPKIKN